MAERDYSGRCLYASVLYITDENCSRIDYRLVRDPDEYRILNAVSDPVRVNKVQ